jgi:hypothetical protein
MRAKTAAFLMCEKTKPQVVLERRHHPTASPHSSEWCAKISGLDRTPATICRRLADPGDASG